jgi:hypothetical protein
MDTGKILKESLLFCGFVFVLNPTMMQVNAVNFSMSFFKIGFIIIP